MGTKWRCSPAEYGPKKGQKVHERKRHDRDKLRAIATVKMVEVTQCWTFLQGSNRDSSPHRAESWEPAVSEHERLCSCLCVTNARQTLQQQLAKAQAQEKGRVASSNAREAFALSRDEPLRGLACLSIGKRQKLEKTCVAQSVS